MAISYTTKRENHAKHNEEVFNYLLQGPDEYVDWVIITAFYTALHYIEAEIFPFTEKVNGNDVEFKSVEHYEGHGEGKNKHAVRMNLVKEKLPSIRKEFQFLSENSDTARYRNYQFKNPKRMKQQVGRRLVNIKKACGQI